MNKSPFPFDADDVLFLKLGELAFEEWNTAENEDAFQVLSSPDLTSPNKAG